MIFPDLPKTRQFSINIAAVAQPEPEPVVVNTAVTADEWFRRHFPEDNQPQPREVIVISPAQALRERIEFAVICIGMVIWAAYWHQFQ